MDNPRQNGHRPRHRVAPELREEIRDLAEKGWSAPEIRSQLDREYDKLRYPSTRTIQRMVEKARPAATSPAWGLTPRGAVSPDEETSFALEVLAAVIETTGGRTRTLTSSDVEWVSAVHEAAKDLDAWMAYRLARRYQVREELDMTTEDLDAWLAFAPWRSKKDADRYGAAVEEGWIDRLPITVDLRSAVIMTTAVLGEEHAEVDATSRPATPPSLWESTKEFKRLQDERKADGQTGSE